MEWPLQEEDMLTKLHHVHVHSTCIKHSPSPLLFAAPVTCITIIPLPPSLRKRLCISLVPRPSAFLLKKLKEKISVCSPRVVTGE